MCATFSPSLYDESVRCERLEVWDDMGTETVVVVVVRTRGCGGYLAGVALSFPLSVPLFSLCRTDGRA